MTIGMIFWKQILRQKKLLCFRCWKNNDFWTGLGTQTILETVTLSIEWVASQRKKNVKNANFMWAVGQTTVWGKGQWAHYCLTVLTKVDKDRFEHAIAKQSGLTSQGKWLCKIVSFQLQSETSLAVFAPLTVHCTATSSNCLFEMKSSRRDTCSAWQLFHIGKKTGARWGGH